MRRAGVPRRPRPRRRSSVSRSAAPAARLLSTWLRLRPRLHARRLRERLRCWSCGGASARRRRARALRGCSCATSGRAPTPPTPRACIRARGCWSGPGAMPSTRQCCSWRSGRRLPRRTPGSGASAPRRASAPPTCWRWAMLAAGAGRSWRAPSLLCGLCRLLPLRRPQGRGLCRWNRRPPLYAHSSPHRRHGNGRGQPRQSKLPPSWNVLRASSMPRTSGSLARAFPDRCP
mmetsp:Transcript_43626/g.123436  ORF Transcript_43626/g.123436 Transcript_43626/m.123436 type:complete len:232 (-) Transcript_43626:133-828(-)